MFQMFSTDSFETSHTNETDMINRVVRLACLNEKSKKVHSRALLSRSKDKVPGGM